MKTKIFLLLAILLLSPFTPRAQAGVPVIDATHLSATIADGAVKAADAVQNAGNWATGIAHKAQQYTHDAKDYIEQMLQSTGILDILSVFQVVQQIQSEVQQALGTVQDIMGMPQAILGDLFGMVGSIKNTVMGVAGMPSQVMGMFDQAQGTFDNLADVDMGIGSGGYMDYGSFGNSYGLYSGMRGVQSRTVTQQLRQTDQDRVAVRRAITTMESGTNAAAIAKGNAQISAATHREIARGNELRALNAQVQTSESYAREATQRANAARAAAAAITRLQ